ncbi:MAG: cytochrome c maturation protein CcmE, partial [Saprospiraceae bacterium]|nr:cytochrome c maturation protein CcmE [Saprospiraceae bacterium]
MKKIHLVGIGMIAVAILLFIQVAGDTSTYATFKDATQADKKVKVAGQLAKDKEIVYDPEVDPNYTSFYMRDAQGEER